MLYVVWSNNNILHKNAHCRMSHQYWYNIYIRSKLRIICHDGNSDRRLKLMTLLKNDKHFQYSSLLPLLSLSVKLALKKVVQVLPRNHINLTKKQVKNHQLKICEHHTYVLYTSDNRISDCVSPTVAKLELRSTMYTMRFSCETVIIVVFGVMT